MRNIDKICGMFFMIFGLFFTIYGPATLPLGTFSRPDSGLFPFWTSLVLTGLSFWLVLKGIRGKQGSALQFGKRWRKNIYSLVGLITYVIFLKQGGFILCTLLFLIYFLKWIEGCSWITTLIFAILSVGLSYICFSWYLGVPLPPGIIPI